MKTRETVLVPLYVGLTEAALRVLEPLKRAQAELEAQWERAGASGVGLLELSRLLEIARVEAYRIAAPGDEVGKSKKAIYQAVWIKTYVKPCREQLQAARRELAAAKGPNTSGSWAAVSPDDETA